MVIRTFIVGGKLLFRGILCHNPTRIQLRIIRGSVPSSEQLTLDSLLAKFQLSSFLIHITHLMNCVSYTGKVGVNIFVVSLVLGGEMLESLRNPIAKKSK